MPDQIKLKAVIGLPLLLKIYLRHTFAISNSRFSDFDMAMACI
ncbi:MAG: hypothetical protein ACOC0R_04205 [Mariniphaga sp.]